MPPITFVAAAEPVYTTVSFRTTLTILTPSNVQTGDTLLMLVTAENSTTTSVEQTLLGSGWSRLGRFTAASAMFEVFRRQVTDDEPAQHVFQLINTDYCQGVLLAYRGMSVGAAIVAAGVVRQAAGSAFACPAQTITNYSDIYIGMCAMAATAGSFAPPAGSVERFDHALTILGVPSAVQVFDRIFEATGTSGVQTSTANVSVHGTACSLVLAATPPFIPKMLVPDIKGAIGLPTIGV